MSLLLHPSSIFNIHHVPVSTILSAYIRSNTLTVAVVNDGEGKGEGKCWLWRRSGDLLGMGEGRVSGSSGKTGSRGSGGN